MGLPVERRVEEEKLICHLQLIIWDYNSLKLYFSKYAYKYK